MVKYRSRLDIIADILNVARAGARKTKIMYVANLSYKLLQKYLGETMDLGFLSFGSNGYEITEKGVGFLEKYSSFSSKYSKLDEELQKMLAEWQELENMCKSGKNGCRKAVL